MKILAFLSLEAFVLYVADFLHTSGDPVIYFATVAASLTAIYRLVIRPSRKAWARIEEGIEKLDQLDAEGLKAIQLLPDWHRGFEHRQRAIEALLLSAEQRDALDRANRENREIRLDQDSRRDRQERRDSKQ